jgi:hypothetical protein
MAIERVPLVVQLAGKISESGRTKSHPGLERQRELISTYWSGPFVIALLDSCRRKWQQFARVAIPMPRDDA